MGLVCYSGFTAEVAKLPCTARSSYSAGFVFDIVYVMLMSNKSYLSCVHDGAA